MAAESASANYSEEVALAYIRTADKAPTKRSERAKVASRSAGVLTATRI